MLTYSSDSLGWPDTAQTQARPQIDISRGSAGPLAVSQQNTGLVDVENIYQWQELP